MSIHLVSRLPREEQWDLNDLIDYHVDKMFQFPALSLLAVFLNRFQKVSMWMHDFSAKLYPPRRKNVLWSQQSQ